MNPYLKWLFPCAGAMAVGWVIGYQMSGGISAPGARRAGQAFASSDSTFSLSATSATGADERLQQTLFGLLRAPDSVRRNRDLYDTVLKMSSADIETAIKQAQRLSYEERDLMMRALLSRWVEIDAPAAMKFALQRDGSDGWQKIVIAVPSWFRADPAAAREWALALPPSPEREQAVRAVVIALAKEDPAAALQLAKTLPQTRNIHPAYTTIFHVWATQNPARAATEAQSLPPGAFRELAVLDVATSWAGSNPQAALDWASQIPEPGLRYAALANAYANWARREPHAAGATALAMPEGETRDRVLEKLMKTVSESNPPFAATFVDQLPAGPVRDNAFAGVADAWAREDTPAALVWAAKLPEEKLRNAALRNVVGIWATSDPQAAADYTLKDETLFRDGSLPALIVEDWAQRQPTEALAWARQLDNEEVRNRALGSALKVIGTRDPRLAATILAELPPTQQRGPGREFIQTWATNDSEGVTSWAMQLPEGSVKNLALPTLIEIRARRDLVEAAQWLEELPASRSRDYATTTFSFMASQKDPEGAAAWAATISDPKMRLDAVMRVATNWLQKDKPAAQRWLRESTTLDPQIRNALLPKNPSLAP